MSDRDMSLVVLGTAGDSGLRVLDFLTGVLWPELRRSRAGVEWVELGLDEGRALCAGVEWVELGTLLLLLLLCLLASFEGFFMGLVEKDR